MKTADLGGALLDYWVARAEGKPLSPEWNTHMGDGLGILVGTGKGDLEPFAPSIYWTDGGPIIERENVLLSPMDGGGWMAMPNHDGAHEDYWEGRTRAYGDTPLEAAMRAVVASKFGDEVPDETPPA